MTHMPIRSSAGHSSLAILALMLTLAGCVAPTEPRVASRVERASAPDAAAPATAAPAAAAPAAMAPAAMAPAVMAPAAMAPDAAAPNAAAPARAGSPAALPGWSSDDLAGLAGAIEAQCSLARPPAPWPRLCPEFRAHRANLRAWLEQRFRAQELAAGDGTSQGLITGYHEPEVPGSRARLAGSQVPLYRKPSQAVLRDRPTRAQIEGSALLAGEELVWLDDPVEAFFLQVQGSGRVRLREGGTMRVGYAADNGQPYRAIGQVLIARGALAPADVDAGTIKAWLRANPREARSVMHANPRYVFFRELPPAGATTGPPGSLGVPLTPMRSVAVDPGRVPAGALLYLDTTDPLAASPLRRVVVAQDTGAAIVGPVRADLFWGSGAHAELAAGRMKQRGRLWRLVPQD